ncbi:hypothetical protein ACFQ88_20815 [Paenibacillus sp. NPDC056579]|uniref:hypothetical protein n=1 Tax=unclassified Paenibacillus TaxID=185978 RepID=UPI001EF835F3|nr:hypothetical protein [Paenibacillus sp. H1-7]ULL13857.1 hypothetical protein DVH26_04985 [Paenibacillus sp. H1-7]
MGYYFSICSMERYQEKYIEFLLEHYSQLRLPYSFPVSLSFIASPVLMNKEAILCFDEENDEIVGAVGLIFGTGENHYQDTHVVQIQIAYIVKEHRSTRLFLEGLQFVTQYLAHLDEGVKELRFWAPADSTLRELFGKLAKRSASHETEFGALDEYYGTLADWQEYAAKFRQITYF